MKIRLFLISRPVQICVNAMGWLMYLGFVFNKSFHIKKLKPCFYKSKVHVNVFICLSKISTRCVICLIFILTHVSSTKHLQPILVKNILLHICLTCFGFYHFLICILMNIRFSSFRHDFLVVNTLLTYLRIINIFGNKVLKAIVFQNLYIFVDL